jgi:3-hydroxybutyryl-CoA dehydratase
VIKLDGADGGLVHIVKGIEPDKMRVGLKVRAAFSDKPTDTVMDIAHFEEDRGGGAARASLPYRLGYTYDELEVGMSATFTKTITETDVYLFAGISGDFNPMHVDEEFARLTPFGTRIAHGALPQALIAPVLGTKLPGLGTVAVETTARFKAPTHFGDTITAKATVAEKLEKKKWVRFDLVWTNQNAVVVAVGSAVVIPPPKM